MKKHFESVDPGWYLVEFNGDRLFREKRAGDRYLYNQRGYKQFHFSDYRLLYKVVFEPIAKGESNVQKKVIRAF